MTIIGRWNFSGSDRTEDERKQDQTGKWQPIEITGASFTEHGLKFGKDAHARAVPKNSTFSISEEKTLIAWVIIDDLSNKRPAGSAITVDAVNKDEFDGIVFGETNDLQWMPGSTLHRRTDSSAIRNLVENATGQLVKMAITYGKDNKGQPEITLYRNDELGKSFTVKAPNSLAKWEGHDVEVLFGVRHGHARGYQGYFPGTIVAAEIHDKCLTKSEIENRMANPSKLRVLSVPEGSTSFNSSGNTQPFELLGTPVIELLLDASGSMNTNDRIGIAKGALETLINNDLPVNTEIALRVFGAEGGCDTVLKVDLGPLNKANLINTINNVTASGSTAIANSLAKVPQDLQSEDGPKVVVLMTDGEETCRGQGDEGKRAVDEELKKLKDLGLDVRISIIGIQVGQALSEEFKQWAKDSGGIYVDASSREEMGKALKLVTSVNYDVLKKWKVVDKRGREREYEKRVANGVVDGPPVEVEAGEYTIEFQLSPKMSESFTIVKGDDNKFIIERVFDN